MRAMLQFLCGNMRSVSGLLIKNCCPPFFHSILKQITLATLLSKDFSFHVTTAPPNQKASPSLQMKQQWLRQSCSIWLVLVLHEVRGLTTALHSKLLPAEDVMEQVLQFRRTQTHQGLCGLLSCFHKRKDKHDTWSPYYEERLLWSFKSEFLFPWNRLLSG